MCREWPARRWDAEKLSAALPQVRVSVSASGSFPRDRTTNSQCPTQTMALAEFLASLRSRKSGDAAGRHYYCHGNVLPDSLSSDCPLPSPLARQAAQVARRSLWISGDGASSPLHYDLPSVLLCQLRGRKRVFLYSPAHHDKCRPRGTAFPAMTAQERIARTLRADLDEDVQRSGLYVELCPGDALLMPSGWWHEVESVIEPGGGAAEDAQQQQQQRQHDESLAGTCISVGMNWPSIADAIPNFKPWTSHVVDYPLLTQGQVLAEFYGEEKVKQMPGFEAVRNLSVFAG